MKLLNNPKSIIGRTCWSWAKKRRRIVSVELDNYGMYIVRTVDDYGNPNCSPYEGYYWDEELTCPLTLKDVQ